MREERFYILPFQLPNIFSKSVAFIAGNTLSIVTASGQLIEWNMSCEAEFRVRTVDIGNRMNGESACQPVVYGGKAYWFTAQCGNLVTFDTNTKSISDGAMQQSSG